MDGTRTECIALNVDQQIQITYAFIQDCGLSWSCALQMDLPPIEYVCNLPIATMVMSPLPLSY